MVRLAVEIFQRLDKIAGVIMDCWSDVRKAQVVVNEQTLTVASSSWYFLIGEDTCTAAINLYDDSRRHQVHRWSDGLCDR
jgi:hypothetical protein